ncbi:MAG: hypothetical protein WC657_07590 [Candidatus Paceibacterota bacterium]|jgi:hypothetical protein
MDAVYQLQVGEKYDYTWSCATIWPGDTISSAVWTFPTGLTKGTETLTDTTATVWVTRTLTGVLIVSGTITSAAGRIEVVTWEFVE